MYRQQLYLPRLLARGSSSDTSTCATGRRLLLPLPFLEQVKENFFLHIFRAGWKARIVCTSSTAAASMHHILDDNHACCICSRLFFASWAACALSSIAARISSSICTFYARRGRLQGGAARISKPTVGGGGIADRRLLLSHLPAASMRRGFLPCLHF